MFAKVAYCIIIFIMNADFQAAEPQPLAKARVRRSRHHPRSGRLLSVSLMLALSWAGVAVFLFSGFRLLQTDDIAQGWLALGGLAGFALGSLGSFILGRHVNCTLCHGPMLHEKRCHKHADAFRLTPLSYRSSTVVSLLSTGTFRCMYCGTPFRLKK